MKRNLYQKGKLSLIACRNGDCCSLLKKISVLGLVLMATGQLFATPPPCAHLQGDVLLYPIVDTLLISDSLSSEREMRGKVNYTPVLRRMSAVNGKQARYSRYASRFISEEEEKRLEELLFEQRSRSCSHYFDHFSIFDAYLYATTPKRRKLRSFPIAVNDSKEEEEYEKDHLHSTNNSQTEETAPLAVTQENKFMFSRSFLALAADSVSSVADEATTDGETSGSNNPGIPNSSLVNEKGEYIGSGNIEVAYDNGYSIKNNKNNWTQTGNSGSLNLHKSIKASYKDAEKTTVVLKEGEISGTNPIYLAIDGAITTKEIVIASGNYQFVPAQNGGTGAGVQDGGIGSPSQSTSWDTDLYVCKDASLTLTDDNHHTGNTYIYGTVNLDGEPEAKKDTSEKVVYATDEHGNSVELRMTGKLGSGDVYVYDGGNLTIGSSHLNNSSLNIEGGTVTLGSPKLNEDGELMGYTLLQNVAGVHGSLNSEDPVAIRLGTDGSGGTLDLTGSWANGYYQLYSGLLTSTPPETPHKHFDENGKLITDQCYNGKISGKIDIDIAAGDTLEIHNIMFTRDLELSGGVHEHKATIDNGGQLKLTGSTDMKLHELTLELGALDLSKATTPILFENYEGTSLAVQKLSVNIDDDALAALIAESENGQVAYQAISIIDSNGNILKDEDMSKYVTTEFLSVAVNDGSRWKAEVDYATGTLYFMAIPEPMVALTLGLFSIALVGTRRRRNRR